MANNACFLYVSCRLYMILLKVPLDGPKLLPNATFITSRCCFIVACRHKYLLLAETWHTLLGLAPGFFRFVLFFFFLKKSLKKMNTCSWKAFWLPQYSYLYRRVYYATYKLNKWLKSVPLVLKQQSILLYYRLKERKVGKKAVQHWAFKSLLHKELLN